MGIFTIIFHPKLSNSQFLFFVDFRIPFHIFHHYGYLWVFVTVKKLPFVS